MDSAMGTCAVGAVSMRRGRGAGFRSVCYKRKLSISNLWRISTPNASFVAFESYLPLNAAGDHLLPVASTYLYALLVLPPA